MKNSMTAGAAIVLALFVGASGFMVVQPAQGQPMMGQPGQKSPGTGGVGMPGQGGVGMGGHMGQGMGMAVPEKVAPQEKAPVTDGKATTRQGESESGTRPMGPGWQGYPGMGMGGTNDPRMWGQMGPGAGMMGPGMMMGRGMGMGGGFGPGMGMMGAGHMMGPGMMNHGMGGGFEHGMGMMGSLMGSPQMTGMMMSLRGDMMSVMGQMMQKYGGDESQDAQDKMHKEMVQRMGDVMIKHGNLLKENAKTLGR
jgi:hypothetical protein